MTALVSTFRGETLKLKRTLALWMVVIAPLVVIAVQAAVVIENPGSFINYDGPDPWLNYLQDTFIFWAALMLPLFITLETALLAQMEHSEQHWKQLYAQPVPRWAHYAAKFSMGLLLVALSSIVLVIVGVLSGLALKAISPQMPFTLASLPLGHIAAYAGRIYLASWLIIAIHTWVANRWPSFNLAIGVGVAATVPNAMLASSEKWAPRYPWTLPFVESTGLLHSEAFGSVSTTVLLVGLVGGLLVALITGWEFSRRDVL